MLTPGICDHDPLLYRFMGELFVGPGVGFFGSRLQCELWLSADEIFIDRPRKAQTSRTMAHFLDQRFKRDRVQLHYPARLWLLNMGVRLYAGNLPSNRIAVFIPDPLEHPQALFARLAELGWPSVKRVPA